MEETDALSSGGGTDVGWGYLVSALWNGHKIILVVTILFVVCCIAVRYYLHKAVNEEQLEKFEASVHKIRSYLKSARQELAASLTSVSYSVLLAFIVVVLSMAFEGTEVPTAAVQVASYMPVIVLTAFQLINSVKAIGTLAKTVK